MSVGQWIGEFEHRGEEIKRLESEISSLNKTIKALKESANYCSSCGWLLPNHFKGCDKEAGK